jgi:Fe-S-cluster containining protein
MPEAGPLHGGVVPVHGGQPDESGCNGCIDCCHLPEISVTDEEAARLRAMYQTVEQPLGELSFSDDPAHEGWKIMAGPCVFRRYDRPLARGGCRIYDDRPSGCAIFTCRLLLDLRRSIS